LHKIKHIGKLSALLAISGTALVTWQHHKHIKSAEYHIESVHYYIEAVPYYFVSIQGWFESVFNKIRERFPIGYFDYPVLGIRGLVLEKNASIISDTTRGTQKGRCNIGYGRELSLNEGSFVYGNLIQIGDEPTKLSTKGSFSGGFTFGIGRHCILPETKTPAKQIVSLNFKDRKVNAPVPNNIIYDLGVVTLQKGETLQLGGGGYLIQSLALAQGANIVNGSGQQTNIYLRDSKATKDTLIFQANQSRIGNAESAALLKVWYSNKGKIRLTNNTKVFGSIYAPYASVVLEPNTQLKGAIVTEHLTIAQGSNVRYLQPSEF
jgi:hypothetical protein